MFASAARLRKPHAVYFLVGGHGGDPLQKLARHHNALVTERERIGPRNGVGKVVVARRARGRCCPDLRTPFCAPARRAG
jgi:hypothetical protein